MASSVGSATRAVDGPGSADGWLLYVKATLSGDEPVDVLNFAALDKAFPHDSTSQQFFDEDRFESYRALGRPQHHVSGGRDRERRRR